MWSANFLVTYWIVITLASIQVTHISLINLLQFCVQLLHLHSAMVLLHVQFSFPTSPLVELQPYSFTYNFSNFKPWKIAQICCWWILFISSREFGDPMLLLEKFVKFKKVYCWGLFRALFGCLRIWEKWVGFILFNGSCALLLLSLRAVFYRGDGWCCWWGNSEGDCQVV